jgi:hypothetical protein
MTSLDEGAPSETRQMAERERADTAAEAVPRRAIGILIIALALLIGYAISRFA